MIFKVVSQLENIVHKLFGSIPEWLISLLMRLTIFHIFWWAAQTKISGLTVLGQHFAFWDLTDNTFFLFELEYKVPLISPNLAAYLGTFGEFFFSLMVLTGLLTRVAAIGLLCMTLTIQFFVYPDAWWNAHVFWIVILLYLIKNGAGQLSLDALIFSKKN